LEGIKEFSYKNFKLDPQTNDYLINLSTEIKNLKGLTIWAIPEDRNQQPDFLIKTGSKTNDVTHCQEFFHANYSTQLSIFDKVYLSNVTNTELNMYMILVGSKDSNSIVKETNGKYRVSGLSKYTIYHASGLVPTFRVFASDGTEITDYDHEINSLTLTIDFGEAFDGFIYFKKEYVHTQAVAALEWTVVHNLDSGVQTIVMNDDDQRLSFYETEYI